MTNEGGRSHARNALEFSDVADVLAALTVRRDMLKVLRRLSRELVGNLLAPARAARVALILGKETVLHRVRSMATEHYWGSVVRLGPAAVKYSLHPHPSTALGTLASSASPNYLREDFVNRLGRGPIRFELALQYFVDEATTPVNDASVAWRCPLVSVADIVIPRQPKAQVEDTVDKLAFNPTHGFEPLGITHSRKAAYATSAQNRGAMSSSEAAVFLANAGLADAALRGTGTAT